MTPQEKAKDLYDSYWYCLLQSNIVKRDYWSQQCALIAVDEILKSHNNLYGVNGEKTKYYLEVQQEIEKI
jgi:hypothetical protein